MTIPYGAPIPYGSPDYSYEGTTMTLQLGVDVSTYQGAIGWAEVAGSAWGDFALCRMSIGRTTRDDRGRANLRGMLGASIPVPGAYGVVGYAEPVEDGADLLLAEIAAVGADPAEILVMLDAEDFGDGSHPTIDQVDRYARRLHADLGRWPVAYVPGWWLAKYGYTAAGRGLSNCPWAQSHYHDPPWTEIRLQAFKPALAFGFRSLAWLQFTSSGSVPGVTGRVDLNCYYGTVQELRAQLLGVKEDDMTIADLRKELTTIGSPTRTAIRELSKMGAEDAVGADVAAILEAVKAAANPELVAALIAGQLEITGITTDPVGVVTVTFGPKTTP